MNPQHFEEWIAAGLPPCVSQKQISSVLDMARDEILKLRHKLAQHQATPENITALTSALESVRASRQAPPLRPATVAQINANLALRGKPPMTTTATKPADPGRARALAERILAKVSKRPLTKQLEALPAAKRPGFFRQHRAELAKEQNQH